VSALRAISELDVFLCLAQIAVSYNFTRPTMTDEAVIIIKGNIRRSI
jgi:DNA mismatch repair ATPase MutS